MKRLLSSALLGAALTVGACVSANALPSIGTAIPAASSIVEKVHDYHRHCAAGPRGWVHRHTHDDDKVPCRQHYRGSGSYYGGGGHGGYHRDTYYSGRHHDSYHRGYYGDHHRGYYRDSGPSIQLRFGHW